MAAGGLTDEESAKIFGEEWTAGVVPDRGTKEYVDYLEEAIKAQTEQHEKQMLEAQTQQLENNLRWLSLSQLPPAHGQVGWQGQPALQTVGTASTEQRGVANLSYKLSKLCPEYYCDPAKTFEKMTFRELIRGCAKVLSFLRVSNVNVDGYLSHLSFLLDKAAMGVYTTEGLVLYERSVTTKV